jgi:predicted RNA methylase
MRTTNKDKQVIEFGDFQTPPRLAADACALLARLGVRPGSIVEPTCGLGHFLLAAARQFPEARQLLGVDINRDYVAVAQEALRAQPYPGVIRILHSDFFAVDWSALLDPLPEPVLIIGNPPWVTNSRVSAIDGENLPIKRNRRGCRGIDAVTGKSNFDISEWMVAHLLEQGAGKTTTLAMLCKTSVARRILLHAWATGLRLSACAMYLIDAAESFGASVEACLLVCQMGAGAPGGECQVYGGLDSSEPHQQIGYRDGFLVVDVALYERWRHLQGDGPRRWRSGVKHDCVKVMELGKLGRGYLNGLGETVDLEEEYVFPMLKSADLAKVGGPSPRRWMLVPQRAVGDDTSLIRHRAPKTWAYLERHGALLDCRASSIYRKKPRFAVFGVGPYTFAPWKVAISGLYKKLEFRVVGNVMGKPIVLDDTANFLPCSSRQEAEFLHSLLGSSAAREFYGAFVQWDSKRPITVELLQRLNLSSLATELGKADRMKIFLADRETTSRVKIAEGDPQQSLFSVSR